MYLIDHNHGSFHACNTTPFHYLALAPNVSKAPQQDNLPSPMSVFMLILITYFMVVSGIVYDVIVEPPGRQDPHTSIDAATFLIFVSYVMSTLFVHIKICRCLW